MAAERESSVYQPCGQQRDGQSRIRRCACRSDYRAPAAQEMTPFQGAALGVYLHACGGDDRAEIQSGKLQYAVARDLITQEYKGVPEKGQRSRKKR